MIRAPVNLPGITLLVAGEGPDRERLQGVTVSLGVAGRVRFSGPIEHDRPGDFYGAADALMLASSREGWPNVLLESMACGTPVVCTRVGGTPEVVAAPEAVLLVDERSPDAVILAVKHLFANYPDRIATRRFAEQFSWEETIHGQVRLFEEVPGRAKRP
jgi:teichuronic acid biosynthesis glycosyltransferase TuaC